MTTESIEIRSVRPHEKQVLAKLIRHSYLDVAERFGLTTRNCSKHPSNCTESWIERDFDRGVSYFFACRQNEPAGCVALEMATDQLAYLERLAVLPAHRRMGLGESLAKHALGLAQAKGAENVSVGIIAAQEELKDWYLKMGFAEGDTKTFEHLPFMVTFMSYNFS